MLANVAVDAVELAGLWADDIVGIANFFITDTLSFILMVISHSLTHTDQYS